MIMTNTQWRNNLISPFTQQPLKYDSACSVLRSQDGQEAFAVVSGVPRLIKTSAALVSSKSEAHQKLGTTFNYREHYEKDAEVFDYFQAYEDGATLHEARRLHETILKEVPAEAEHLLDVGCGNAWVAEHFCPKGKTVISLDIASRNPEKALEKYPFLNHFALVADVYALPFRPNTFDCIIAAEIIEHVADPRLFIDQLLKVLRPGGKLIVTTPFEEKITYSLCIHCNRPTSQHAHLHSFSKDSLAQLVRRDRVVNLKMKSFSNKALTKLQTHIFFKYLPTSLWRVADQLANVIVRKPARLMMTLVKQ